MIATRGFACNNLPVTELGPGCATFAFDAAPQSIDNARQMLANALGIGINPVSYTHLTLPTTPYV